MCLCMGHSAPRSIAGLHCHPERALDGHGVHDRGLLPALLGHGMHVQRLVVGMRFTR